MLVHDWFPRPLPANVVIGARSWCYSSYAFLHYQSRRPCGVRVGHDSGIYRGTFFELGPEGEVEIGNYATVVGAIISTRSRILIGDYAFVSHEVVLADTFGATPFAQCSANQVELGYAIGRTQVEPQIPSIVIGENAWIGARALLTSGARIGTGAIVGAAAVVDFEVPPFAIVAGNPARVVGWAEKQVGAASHVPP